MVLLESIYHLGLTEPHWAGPENIHFSVIMKNSYTKGVNRSTLEELWDHSSLQGNLTVVTAVTKLENLNAMRVIGSLDDRSQVVSLNCQRQSGCGLPQWMAESKHQSK